MHSGHTFACTQRIRQGRLPTLGYWFAWYRSGWLSVSRLRVVRTCASVIISGMCVCVWVCAVGVTPLWTHFCFAHTTKQARKTSHYWVLIAWYRSGVVECVTFVSSVRLLSGVCVFGCVTTVCVCLCVCACGACGACVRYFSLW